MYRDASRPPTIRILGTHGVPAGYGGFETAAENVAFYLRDHGWRVIVYCQETGSGPIRHDRWRSIDRIIVPIPRTGWLGTSAFDWRTIRDAVRHDDLCLTFGYNTAVLNLLQVMHRIPNVINMDGVEWSRARWGWPRQAILLANEMIAGRIGTHLIADHPRIANYLAKSIPRAKISTIAYGAHPVTAAPEEAVRRHGLTPGRYLTLICRPIPENSILELVSAFSARHRGYQLAVLGDYDPQRDGYHRTVMDAASDEVAFLGAIYDPETVNALRFHCVTYLHGHTVGGTNPSLVEAMAAGNAIIAHRNGYNQWVAGDGALFFESEGDARAHIDSVLSDDVLRRRLAAAATARYRAEFTWDHVAGQYEQLLRRFLPSTEAS